jgi:uncharacterized protein YjbI with pentapeptide repeats
VIREEKRRYPAILTNIDLSGADLTCATLINVDLRKVI